LVLVHLDNGAPVLGDLGEVERLGKVDEVENVLLEARTAKALVTCQPVSVSEPSRALTTDALRNLGPTRESLPTAWATSSTLAPVASQMADRALIDEIR
jgi:hypothetical protein